MRRNPKQIPTINELYSMNKIGSWLAILLVFVLASCDQPEYTSVAVQVGETYETEVIKHPDWTKTSAATSTTWTDLLAAFELFGSKSTWQTVQDMELDMVIIDLPLSDDKMLRNCLEPLDKHMVIGKDSVKDIITEANGYGIHVLFNWEFKSLGARHPWVNSCPECFSPDTLEDGQLAFVPRFIKPQLADFQKGAIAQWIDSCGFNGYYSLNSIDQPLLVWEELIRSFESQEQKILAFTDNPDPAVHSVAFHASRNQSFDKLFDIISTHFIKQKAEEMNRHEVDQFLVNAYRLHHITAEEDSAHASNIQDLKTIFAYTSKSLPVCEGLAWEADTLGNVFPYFTSGTDVELVSILGKLKRENEVLWNGFNGGEVEMKNSKSLSLIAFSRSNKEDDILTMLNCSGEPIRVELSDPVKHEYLSIDESAILFSEHTNGTLVLKPYSYWIFKKQKPRFTNEPG
ncbi:MAG: hypothetical protein ACI943_002516 [Gammaproteobacteria bacterium]|jgi:hypothetical protein